MQRTEEELRLAQIDELWRALVPGHTGDIEQRNIAAVRVLIANAEIMRSSLIAKGEKENVAGYNLAIFQLIAADLLDWISSYFFFEDNPSSEGVSARLEAISACFYADHCVQPQFRPDLRTVLVALPRACFEQIRSGLEALKYGEVQPIFEPSFSHRRGDTWSWDQARLTAVEHVLFLHGQGLSKKNARKRVAQATGCVHPDTLESWEKGDLASHLPKQRFDLAKKAGTFYADLDADPSIWSEDRPADAHIVQAMRSLKGSLASFGRAYAASHGDRHRSGS